jgi:hypothetical protein
VTKLKEYLPIIGILLLLALAAMSGLGGPYRGEPCDLGAIGYTLHPGEHNEMTCTGKRERDGFYITAEWD